MRRRSPPRCSRPSALASRARRRSRSTSCRSGGRFTLGPFDVEFVVGRPFDPGIERAHHPHPARHGAAHRRLEDRPDAGHRRRRPTRPSCGRSATRACSRWSAIPPMRSAKAARRRRPTWPRRSPSWSPARAGASRSPPSPPTSRASARPRSPPRAAEREVVVVGRAMERVVQVARETGYLDGIQDFRGADAYGYLPRRQGAGAVHRQPGRAARRARPHRRGRSIRT